MHNFFLRLLFILQVVFTAFHSASQSTIDLPFQKKINTDKGLSSYNANKILQDKFGFIWISTQDGLNRYDGNKFIIYNKSTSSNHLLLGNVINDIVEDTIRNILWVTTSYGGINGIDLITGNVIHTLKCVITDTGFRNGWLRSFDICNEEIWIGSDNGLTVYNLTAHEFIEFESLPFKRSNVNDKLSINSVFTDHFRNVWVYLPDHGLVIYSGITNKILSYYTCSELDIHETKSYWQFLCRFTSLNNSTYILGTDHGFKILKYDRLGKVYMQPFFLNKFFGNEQITACTINKTGTLWFATPGYLHRYNLKEKKYQTVKDISKQESGDWLSFINYIFFDSQNNVWIASDKGAAFCRNIEPAFTPYIQAGDATVRVGHASYIFPFNDSVLYVCALDGFYEVNILSGEIVHVDDNIYNYVFKSFDGKIITSCDKGLFIYDNRIMISLEKEYPELSSIKNELINSAIAMADSMIVLGSESSKGIYLWNFKKHVLQNIRLSIGEIENPIINNIYKDSRNKIWVLFDNAIAILDVGNNNHYKRFQIEDPDLKVPVSIFNDICEVKDDIWLAVYGKGIIQIDSNSRIKKIYSSKDGLTNTGVYKVLPYHDSLIFVTSNNGFFSIDIKNQKVHQYLKEDGLNTNNFEEFCGYIKGNTFYIGGENGFTFVNPASLQNNIVQPLLFIDQFNIKTSNSIIDSFNLHFKTFVIPNNALQTTISFSALNYINPTRTVFEYRIKELNSNWIDLGNQNFISLIGLRPGTYTLEVKAANEDGVWCEPKQLTLTFLPKWYQTWLFKIMVGLSAASLLYGLYRYRLTQIRKQHQIRKEIAGDLHDDIGATINSVKIFTHLAETSPDKKKYFTHIKESLTQASAGLRDMIWVLDDAGDTAGDLFKRLQMFAHPVTEASGVKISFNIDDTGANIVLNKTEKRNLLLIAKEAINNSIKYAECENISVTFSKPRNKTTLVIRDDGKGFSDNKITPGNGLRNMRERAHQVHYNILIESEDGVGTNITLVKK